MKPEEQRVLLRIRSAEMRRVVKRAEIRRVAKGRRPSLPEFPHHLALGMTKRSCVMTTS
jgi:hypothetical protein